MKRAKVIKENGKYYVMCYDGGWVYMSELTDQHEWITSTFNTLEEAQAAADRYSETWN